MTLLCSDGEDARVKFPPGRLALNDDIPDDEPRLAWDDDIPDDEPQLVCESRELQLVCELLSYNVSLP